MLLDCCVKNCDKSFSSAINAALLSELITISSGKYGPKLAVDSIRLLDDLNTHHSQSNPKIQEAYQALKSKGLIAVADRLAICFMYAALLLLICFILII